MAHHQSHPFTSADSMQSHLRRLASNNAHSASAAPRSTSTQPQTVPTMMDQQMTVPSDAPKGSLHPPAPSSGRKGSKKVRTGCITCKIRKVKCDEARPVCVRCTKTGRKCDGYLSPRQSSNRNGSGRAISSSEVIRLSPPLSPFADWVGGVREQHAFDFYRSFSAPSIFSDDSSSSTLWKKLVPHFCHAEPAIRHAVLAISSLHESLSLAKPVNTESNEVPATERWGGVPSNTFAAEQYGKALKSLQEWKPTDSTAITVPLLACLLFICIEFMLGDEDASQIHINQGRLILSQIGSGMQSGDVDVIKKHFVPIYSRLSLASFLFGSNPAEIPSNLRSSSATNLYFVSVEEAEVALYELIDEGLRLSKKAKVAVYSRPRDDPILQSLQRQQEEYLAKLNRWHVAFTIVAALHDTKRSGKICLVYYHTAKIYVSTALSPFETAYDDHISSFTAIISLSAEILQYCRKSAENSLIASMPVPRFIFDTEIIPPLYYTIVRCRHPMLRRTAAELLSQDAIANRRENLWDAHMSAEVGKRIMAIEENSVHREATDLETTNWDTTFQNSLEDSVNLYPTSELASEVSVPYMQYPQIPKAMNHQSNMAHELAKDFAQSRQDTPGSVSTGTSTVSSGSENSWASSRLEPPFDLPEYARVKNTLIDHESLRGSWITIFMDPEEAGAQHWKITKEFVKVR
ncbi:C6 zinc finger domain protein [Colletotrichum truncatum]|uniref:C6 zinc finger domain protein n=1 Tax=Colletotrichum truncatum TaxID=5467 RepID=A0ACC3YNY7_COLTU|nr:C6 zinc finger domain protein [Colletotrichum truncatum]KAF6782818.1 C6 zinc finger domain protein [Colletotrichum truncatum]